MSESVIYDSSSFYGSFQHKQKWSTAMHMNLNLNLNYLVYLFTIENART